MDPGVGFVVGYQWRADVQWIQSLIGEVLLWFDRQVGLLHLSGGFDRVEDLVNVRWVVRQLIDNVVRWGLEFHGFLIGLGNHLDLRDLGDLVYNEG